MNNEFINLDFRFVNNHNKIVFSNQNVYIYKFLSFFYSNFALSENDCLTVSASGSIFNKTTFSSPGATLI